MALPTGYTEVQYIQSTGVQYLDTGFKPNQDTRIVADFQVVSFFDNWQGIFAARDAATNSYKNTFSFWITNDSRYRTDFINDNGIYFGTPDLDRHIVDKNKVSTTLDNVSVTNSSGTFSCEYSLVLFSGRSGNVIEYPIKTKIYSCKIYDNGSLIRDYIPCINPDGEAGLYDMVNSKFYGNAGTGVFFAGPPRVSLPSGYKQLEYIQGTGSQYLNTDAKPNQNTRLVADFEVLSWPSSQFLGARTSAANTAFNILVANATSGRDDWNTSAINFTSENARWKIDKNKNVTAINSSVITHATGSFSCPVPIYLFAVNNNGSLMATGCAGAKCYSCQIYDNTTLIRDYIPCMNPAGAIGLYDLVNSKFYANAGTGVFTAGPEVTWPSNDAIYVKVNGIWRQIDGIKLL